MAGAVLLKVGGSLLDWPGLPGALGKLLLGLRSRNVAIVVGGGTAADVVRNWDLIFPLTSEQSHWLAIDSMDLTARLLQVLLPGSELVANEEQLKRTWEKGRVAILLPKAWMEIVEFSLSGLTLPHQWDVTSDSIALRLAGEIHASRFVLIKSRSFPFDVPVQEWGMSGFVDPFFFEVAGMFPEIKLGWMNLRDMEPVELFERPAVHR
ncbi:hypothetical protein [Lacunimicrobium album]